MSRYETSSAYGFRISSRKKLLKTLKAIHEAGVIHRDIRLSNLCSTANGEAFVIDFSHAALRASHTRKNREIADIINLFESDAKNVNIKSTSQSRKRTSRRKGKVQHTVRPSAEGLRRSLRIKAMAGRRLDAKGSRQAK